MCLLDGSESKYFLENKNVHYSMIVNIIVTLSMYYVALKKKKRKGKKGKMKKKNDIAIIGVSCKLPGADNPFQFWEQLASNNNCISEVPKDRWEWQEYWGNPKEDENKTNSRWGGFIKDAYDFDHDFFGLIPKVVGTMDPRQRLALELTWKCLEDAGVQPSSIRGKKVGFILSNFNHKDLQGLGNSTIEPHDSTGSASPIIANRVSHFFDFKGPSLLIDTACSGSLHAIHCAVQALQMGDCNLALAGGIHLMPNPTLHISLAKMGMMSPTGTCKTFDESANGYVRGEGAGILLLKPLEKALKDNDSIYGVIKGTAVNHCGETYTLTYPSADAQADVIIQAHERAGVPIDTINYIEAHGTGTPKGDPIEFQGLKQSFEELAKRQNIKLKNNYCGLGTAKTNIGHLEPAAGVAGVIKVLLQMRNRQLPAVHHFKKLNHRISIENTPFYIVDEKQKWTPSVQGENTKTDTKQPLRAGVSAFGFGGTNAHIVLEQAPERAINKNTKRELAVYPIVLSAKSKTALKEMIEGLQEWLVQKHQDNAVNIIDLSYTLSCRREHLLNRVACVVENIDDLIKGLSTIDIDKTTVYDFRKHTKNAKPNKFEKQAITFLNTYLNGESVEFNGLFSAKKAKVLRLPTYPFTKNRFLLTHNKKSQQTLCLHPLVHTNISDFELQSYHSSFSGNEFTLKDHQVQGKSVLPGAAYIEMVTQSIFDSTRVNLNDKALQVNDIAWLRPIVAEGKNTEIFINLYPTENNAIDIKDKKSFNFSVEFEITSSFDGEKTIHCQGVVTLLDKPVDKINKDQVTNLAVIRSDFYKSDRVLTCHAERFYQLMGIAGLDYGAGYRGIVSLDLLDDTAIVHVSLPEIIKSGDREKYIVHPSLLDASIQSSVAVIWANQFKGQSKLTEIFNSSTLVNDIQAQLPFLLENALIQNGLGDELLVVVRLKNQSNDIVHKFDVDIANINSEGDIQNIALSLKGLTLKTLSKETLENSEKTNATSDREQQNDVDHRLSIANDEGYYAPLWLEQSSAITETISSNKPSVLIVYQQQQRSLAQSHIKHLSSKGADVIELMISDEFLSLNDEQKAHIRTANEEDASSFVTTLKQRKVSLDYVLHIPASASYAIKVEDLNKCCLAIDNTVKTLFLLTKALIKYVKKLRFMILVSGEIFSQPQYLGLSGFFKTLNQEKPSFNGRVVQVDRDDLDYLNYVIEQEFFDPQKSNDIAYINNKRYIRSFEDCNAVLKRETQYQPLQNLNNEDAKFIENGVYVITGGLGALGLIFARHLLSNYNAKVYLTGRSTLNDKKTAEIESLNKLDGQVEYIQCDVNDFDSVKHCIDKVRGKNKKLDGILHSAGIIEDDFIIKKSFISFEKVITPKSHGTINLDLATIDDQLSCFILFSSVAGALGNIGQCDYGYGNAFEDYFSLYRNILREQGLRKGKTTSINWPYWRDGGMSLTDKELEAVNKNFGIIPLETKAGIEATEKALQLPIAQLSVLPGDTEKIRQVLGCTGQINNQMQSVDLASSNMDNHLSFEELKKNASEYLIGLFAKELKVPEDRFTMEGAFQEFGFDSVVMLDMIGLMEERFANLPKTLFFENQSISELSSFLAENYVAELSPKQKNAASEDQTVIQNKAIENTSIRQRLSRTRLYDSGHTNTAKQSDFRIAIIGLAGRYPEADNIDEFWENLANGVDCIREVPTDRWDIEQFFQPGEKAQGKSYSKWGGFLKDVDKFDPLFFNISPKEAEKIDPQERLFLEVVYHAIENAGYHPNNLASAMPNRENPVGVYAGAMWGDYQLHGVESSNSDNWVTPHSFYWSIANRVSYLFNFSGPSMTLDTACSSSLTAIHLACNAIVNGEIKVGIAGGVSLSLHANKYNLLSDLNFLSSDGRCRSFGEDGDGYVPGECVSAVVLKSLADAERDGDHIYGVIRGTSVNHGGKTSGFTVPNPKRQASLIKEALDKAEVNPRHISYVEAHGTGTSLGDPVEISGLTKAYAQSEHQYCTIGSAKSNIGHTEASAGIAALSKVLLQMKHKQLAPSLHSQTLNPFIDFATTPFKVNQDLTAWDRPLVVDESGNDMELPRIAGISSFGAGGANGHIIVEEYVSTSETEHAQGENYIIPISAKKKQSLYHSAENLRDFLVKNENQDLNSLAYTLQTGRVEHDWRLAIMTQNQPELIDQLSQFLNGEDLIKSIFYKNLPIKVKADSHKITPDLSVSKQTTESLRKLANSWVNGSNIIWSALYGKQTPTKSPLPGYAYQRQRYWIEKNNAQINIKGLHPVLHKNISTLLKVAYTTSFHSSDFYLKDHQINGNRIVPAVVYLEMAYQAISDALPDAKIESIYDIQWLKPIVVNSGENINDFVLEISEDSYGYIFEITQEQDTVRQVYCKGAFGLIQASKITEVSGLNMIENRLDSKEMRNKQFDIAELRRSASSISNLQLNEKFEKMGFKFGETFQPFKETFFKEHYALSQLELPQAAIEPCSNFVLNPVILDAALRTSTAIGFNNIVPAATALPVDLSRLQILRPLENNIHVYVEKVNSRREVSGRDEFDIYLLDQRGRVLLYLEYFATQKVEGFLTEHVTRSNAQIKKDIEPRQTEAINSTVSNLNNENTGIAVLNHLKSLLSEQTKIAIQDINESESVESYGIDSVMMHTINEKLTETFDEEISKTLFYEYATIGEVADYLAENYATQAVTLVKTDNHNQSAIAKNNLQNKDTNAVVHDDLNAMELYLSNCISTILGTDLSHEKNTKDIFLDDIQQLKLSHKLRVELNISLGSSAMHIHHINELASYMIETHSIDFDALEKLNNTIESKHSIDAAKPAAVSAAIQQLPNIERIHSNRKLLANLLATGGNRLNKRIQTQNNEDIAIIGLSGRYPLADNLDDFWKNLIEARDCIREIPVERWQHAKYFDPNRTAKGKVYSKWGGFLDDVDQFDADFFKMTRREAELLDPQERLFLQTAWQCLEDASYSKNSLQDSSVGVFVGVMWGHYELIQVSQQQEKFGRPTASFSSIANRVSYFFDFHGPSLAMDSMCSSSLSAIHTACQSIRSGDCEYAIAGGVNITSHVTKYQQLCQQQFLSDDGRCRAFGEGGSGYVPGEGVGSVLLKPLQKAIADGDNIYAVVKGSAINHGGKTSGFTVPNQRQQSQVISKAIKQAGWSADSIQYVEAHGTGTSLGDPIEVSGLTKAFVASEQDNRKEPCFIGSVKSNIGHLESAAGIAGLTKILLQMKNGMIAPSLHSKQLNPNLTMDKNRFNVPQKACEWRRRTDESGNELPRRAGLSSFGAGGSNSHLLIEEFIQKNAEPQKQINQLNDIKESFVFVLSADTKQRLKGYVERVNRFIIEKSFNSQAHETTFLRQLSCSSLFGRVHQTQRLAIIYSTVEELTKALKAYLQSDTINGLYVGTYNKNSGLYNIVDKETRAVLLSSLLKPGRMDALANAWVSSMDIEWHQYLDQIFNGHIPNRMSFPSQPLFTERFWVDEASQSNVSSIISSIHPLLDANISTIQHQSFTKIFTGKEFYLNDHQVENDGAQKILPGVAYLEMAHAAASMSVPSDYDVYKIRDVMWLAPIQVDDKARKIKVVLSQKGHGMEYKVIDMENDTKLYSSGDVDFSYSLAPKGIQTIDIESIKRQGGLKENLLEIYQKFHSMGFYYGPAYQVTEWRICQDNSTLAKLKLPEFLQSDRQQYVLHPCLMDGAIRTCLTLGQQDHSSPMVPFSLGEIEIFAPITAECYVHATISDDNQQNTDSSVSSTASYDLVIADLQGNILVKINQITARSLSKPDDKDSLNYFEYDWKTAKVNSDQTADVVGLLGFANEEKQKSIYHPLCSQDKQIWVTPGKGYSELSNNHYTIRLDHQQDYQRLFESLDKRQFKLSHVINLLNTKNVILDSLGSNNSELESDIQYELDCSLHLIYFLFRQINQYYSDIDIRFLDVNQMQDKQRNPFKAAMVGFANSMVAINHKIQMCSLSISDNNEKGHLNILKDILRLKRMNGREFRLLTSQQGLQERLLTLSQHPDEKTATQSFKENNTYIITGGLGKIGLVIAEYLVTHYKCNLILVSRSKPSGSQQKNIDKLIQKLQMKSPIHTVEHKNVDISDHSSVRELFAQVKATYGEINGLIHAAGQATETSVLELNSDEFSLGLSAKIHGLIYLTTEAHQYNLDFIINFSSVSSQLGDLGSGNYAASNRFMDEYALYYKQRHNGVMQSINWPLWNSGGLTMPDSEIAAMRFSGMAPMPEDKGIEAFEYALAKNTHQIFVVYGQKSRIMQKFSVAHDNFNVSAIEKVSNDMKKTVLVKNQVEEKQIPPSQRTLRKGQQL